MSESRKRGCKNGYDNWSLLMVDYDTEFQQIDDGAHESFEWMVLTSPLGTLAQ